MRTRILQCAIDRAAQVIAHFDDDDIYAPCYLEKMVSFFMCGHMPSISTERVMSTTTHQQLSESVEPSVEGGNSATIWTARVQTQGGPLSCVHHWSELAAWQAWYVIDMETGRCGHFDGSKAADPSALCVCTVCVCECT